MRAFSFLISTHLSNSLFENIFEFLDLFERAKVWSWLSHNLLLKGQKMKNLARLVSLVLFTLVLSTSDLKAVERQHENVAGSACSECYSRCSRDACYVCYRVFWNGSEGAEKCTESSGYSGCNAMRQSDPACTGSQSQQTLYFIE